MSHTTYFVLPADQGPDLATFVEDTHARCIACEVTDATVVGLTEGTPEGLPVVAVTTEQTSHKGVRLALSAAMPTLVGRLEAAMQRANRATDRVHVIDLAIAREALDHAVALERYAEDFGPAYARPLRDRAEHLRGRAHDLRALVSTK